MDSTAQTQLIERLETSQRQLVILLGSMTHKQEWQTTPGQCSFRSVAAHLVLVETQLFAPCARQIASGDWATVPDYRANVRIFRHSSLTDSLTCWTAARRDLVQFLRTLPQEAWLRSGVHHTFGRISLFGLAQMILDHDRVTLLQVEQMMVDCWRTVPLSDWAK